MHISSEFSWWESVFTMWVLGMEVELFDMAASVPN